MELFMGQIARLDTFLDTCFLVLLIQCDITSLIWPVAFFCFFFLTYPLFQIFSLCKVRDDLDHTQPYMERNNQLAFIRENMLLATVFDKFCLNNTVKFFGQPICFGKLMGAYTFLL